MSEVMYVMVEVTGAEDEIAAIAAIENLTNAEQQFSSTSTMVVSQEHVDNMGEPVIYFP